MVLGNNGNIGLWFNKYYFKGINYAVDATEEDKEVAKKDNRRLLNHSVRGRNAAFCNYTFDEAKRTAYPSTSHAFTLRTTYPGLIFGTGYQHGIGVEGEFKMGFYFDYTSGLPAIPGASIKGALRSAFPKFLLDKSTDRKLKLEKAKYIWCLLTGDWSFQEKEVDRNAPEVNYVHQLEEEIFEGKRGDIPFSIYKRDIFHEAILVSGNVYNNVFAKDFITPHKHKTNPKFDRFADPNPLMFLKIIPDVKFKFRFQLHNSGIANPITGKKLDAEDKLNLFKQILLTIGAGAKTNVGYGQFETLNDK